MSITGQLFLWPNKGKKRIYTGNLDFFLHLVYNGLLVRFVPKIAKIPQEGDKKMKDVLFYAMILVISMALAGCAGLNVRERAYYGHKQRVCENGSCSTVLVEDEFVSDAPQPGYSYVNIGARIGKNGYVNVGNYNNYGGYNGYNGFNGYGNGYNGYNAYGYPVWYQNRPGCNGVRCW